VTVRVAVGRVGRPHGVNGASTIAVFTDEPDLRFEPGTRLFTSREGSASLLIESVRWMSNTLCITFEGREDRSAAEGVRGTFLFADVDENEVPTDPDEFYDRHLMGLAAKDVAGNELGTVTDVVHAPGQDMLVISVDDGDSQRDVLVPFVHELVPEVDPHAGFVRIDPPPGLFEDVDAADPAALADAAGEGES
jgi:16S rRNA processing protein RimM